MSLQISTQESLAVLVLTFELDLKKHFLDIRHDTDPMASEPDKNMSEIWLKLWTFKETGVERLPITHFGATVKHDSTLRGSSISSEYAMVREVSYLVSFMIFFIYRPSMAVFNVLANCFQYILAFSESFSNLLSVETRL